MITLTYTSNHPPTSRIRFPSRTPKWSLQRRSNPGKHALNINPLPSCLLFNISRRRRRHKGTCRKTATTSLPSRTIGEITTKHLHNIISSGPLAAVPRPLRVIGFCPEPAHPWRKGRGTKRYTTKHISGPANRQCYEPDFTVTRNSIHLTRNHGRTPVSETVEDG